MINIFIATPEPYQFQELFHLMELQFYHVSLVEKVSKKDQLSISGFDVFIFDELLNIEVLLDQFSSIDNKPKICLMRNDNIDKKITYFEKGCDVCVSASSSSRLIMAYIRSLISAHHEYRLEEKKKKDQLLYIDKENYEAALCGNEIELTPVEFRLLDLLFRGHGKIQSRNYLTSALYGNNDIDSKSLSFNVHISNLRKKLKCSSCSVKIENQVRVGYRLVVKK